MTPSLAHAVLSASAVTRGRRILDNLGLCVSLQASYERFAHRHRPHLLRSKKKRQRKKALRALRRTLTHKDKRLAFAQSVLEEARKRAGET